ncbi:MAG TPA: phosphotransferase [Streptosporangiaceae bacterium]|jgi:hypothetical protein
MPGTSRWSSRSWRTARRCWQARQFDYSERIARYHAAGYFSDADRAALDRLTALSGPPRQFCHGDPLPDNMLITESGEWALLDWEFTGLFLPGFDLAMFHVLLAAPGACDARLPGPPRPTRGGARVGMSDGGTGKPAHHHRATSADTLRRARPPAHRRQQGGINCQETLR